MDAIKKPKKVKVTLSIDENLWNEFQIYCLMKYKRSKNASKLIEDLLKKILDQEYQSSSVIRTNKEK